MSFNSGKQQGFVLLAVMWVLLAMVIAVTVFAQWVQSSLHDAHAQQQELNSRIAAHTAMSVAVYTRLSGQRSAYGVSAKSSQDLGDPNSLFEFDDMGALIIKHESVAQSETFAFDDQVWAFGDLNFVAQDLAGLIGLTSINHQAMVQYLLLKQPNSSVRVEQLIDAYLDYQDADSQRRPYGAESADYRMLKRAPPFNGPLRTPLQLRDILHWEVLLKPYSNGELLYRFKVEGGMNVNINSASLATLSWALGGESVAQRLIEQRQEKPFTNVSSLYSALKVDDSTFTIMPDNGIRFWWWNKDNASAWVHELHYDGLISGKEALKQDWMLRVDIPEALLKQQSKSSPWSLLGQYQDYLGRSLSK